MAENNGRRPSEASSSSSDIYTANATRAKHTSTATTNGKIALPVSAKAYSQDDGGASSEMDVSDSSNSTVSLDMHALSHAGAKRKLSDAGLDGARFASGAQDSAKKPKVSFPGMAHNIVPPATAGWPLELWQQVFVQLSPAMLSRCLRVCKNFNFCLTKMKPASAASKKDLAPALDSEVIWSQARKSTYPNMPRPLAGFSELQMLQLIGGTTCQSCGILHVKQTVNTVLNAGPGDGGVRVIWPFHLRLCGSCFINDSFTDIQMLSSKHPAAPLIRGLPHAFRTPDGHFVPDHIRQGPNGLPPSLRLQKTFHKKDVASIIAELDEVNSFGDGAADEWRKGLTQKGKDAMTDPSRWERWSGTMPLGKLPAEVLREYDLASFPLLLDEQQRRQRQSASQFQGRQACFRDRNININIDISMRVSISMSISTSIDLNTRIIININLMSSKGRYMFSPAPNSARATLNAQEVEAARQVRRADIEQRCQELDVPLQANALPHMKAFRNTMQITTPMTDAFWENVLKPKILEEREEAELQEHNRALQQAALLAAIPSALPYGAYTRPAKEVYDCREYELSQEPLRLKLGEYASDHINGHWHQERSLDQNSAPLFAVDVLLHVRQRYIADRDAGNLTSVIEDVPPFQKQGISPLIPSLTLDNMKWVFDTKVRSYTDPLCRELFICAGCAGDRKPKWYAFEGLVQHYGAKHTYAFSIGNVVVHWQIAQWPDEPPFYEDPAAFIKAERKFSSARGHGRPKGTPQGSIDRNHHSPASATMLSDNPLFASGPTQVAGQNGYHLPHRPAGDYHYLAQVANISADARVVWDQLDRGKDLKEALECVRMQTVIHHVVARFQERFAFKPKVDLLTDSLATSDLMTPIKSGHRLACKICTTEQTGGTTEQKLYYARIRNMKLYNISSLVTHFKLTHQPHGAFEWDKHLLELPEASLVGELINTPGMDDDKLVLIAAAFPSAFPSPLPRIGSIPDPGPDSGLASRLVKKLTKGQPQIKKKRKAHLVNDGNGSAEAGKDPRGDEYDPHQPMFVGKKLAELDLSRFDTDLARKDEPSSSGTPGNFNLAPETLAALSSLQASMVGKSSEPETRHRSASVGRSDSRTASGQPTAPPSLTQVTPEIAAILASLTQGATASATPTSTANQGPSRTPMQPYEPYAHPVQQAPAHPRSEVPHVNDRYAPGGSYPSSVEPSPGHCNGHDLQAALSRNAQNHTQNAHAAYIEPASSAQAYSVAPPQAPSPPRYRIVYEDEPAYAQAYPPRHHYQQPYDGQPAPIQYVPISEGAAAAGPSHRYEQQHYAPPPRRTVYVDQYGHPVELVPIDAAPAPVQYMPHPFDQQQQQQQQFARYSAAPQQFSAPPSQQATYYEHQTAPVYQPPPQQQPPQHRQGSYAPEDDERGSVPRA